MSKAAIAGWIMMIAGSVLWIWGYYSLGHPTLIDWKLHAPQWIANFLPNIESELGTALVIAGMIPAYWPRREKD